MRTIADRALNLPLPPEHLNVWRMKPFVLVRRQEHCIIALLGKIDNRRNFMLTQNYDIGRYSSL